MIQFDIITIFPNIFDSYFNESILKRAQARGLIKIKIHNLRNWATGKHRSVDDRPYGGGPGMVMRADIIYRALQKIVSTGSRAKTKIILLSADGKQFDQKMAYRFSKLKRIVFICGRYEGVDARVEKLVDEKISVGPYVLTGGELPAMTIADAVSRLIPGVIRAESLEEESFTETRIDADRNADRRGLNISVNLRSSQRKPAMNISVNQRKYPRESAYKEYPQYTRPEALTFRQKRAIMKTLRVPKVLLSGNHQKIQEWRTKQIK